MADSTKPEVAATDLPKVEAVKAAPKQNPVFRMMGLPNFRFRLPSRNWMIFWTITGSFTGAVVYDRRQKKAVQKKWCDLVAHVAQQSIAVNELPRKITVFLSAAPGDGIGPSRQYFKEYIKPVLVSAAMDYDVIEGRKQGDVRYGTAEQIRRLRRKQGEQSYEEKVEEMDAAMAIEMMRDRNHVRPEAGIRGDLVLGRHTWKEYIRGLHEGWLGPLDEPKTIEPEPAPESEPELAKLSAPEVVTLDKVTLASDDASKAEDKKSEAKKEKEEEKKKPFPPPAYLTTTEYSTAPLSPHIPSLLEPSAALHQQHLLGFLKFPQRFYNFVNKRKLADDLGREAAAIVFAMNRPYDNSESFVSSADPDFLATRAPESDATEVVQTTSTAEQQTILAAEEPYWHKSIRKRKEGDTSEQTWLEDVVLDPRIAQRMRRFVLDPVEEERANRIFRGIEKSRAIEAQDLTKEKVVVGDVDVDELS